MRSFFVAINVLGLIAAVAAMPGCASGECARAVPRQIQVPPVPGQMSSSSISATTTTTTDTHTTTTTTGLSSQTSGAAPTFPPIPVGIPPRSSPSPSSM